MIRSLVQLGNEWSSLTPHKKSSTWNPAPTSGNVTKSKTAAFLRVTELHITEHANITFPGSDNMSSRTYPERGSVHQLVPRPSLAIGRGPVKNGEKYKKFN